MKFPGSEIGHILGESKNRRNLASLLRYVVFLIGVILLFSGIFRVLMERLEGETYSWVTAIYWTLVTMTTLGYGELTFSSGGGQLFSIVVVLSGLVLLLVVLPFAFIRFFYAPWLEAQLRLQAPRSLPNSTRGHVIISRHDEIAAALIQRLGPAGIPHYVVESDPAVAAQLLADGVDVIAAQLDERTTYEQLQLQQARLLFANSGDTRNSNIALTAREVSDTVPIVGVVESEDSIDVLEFSGCTQVLPLKTRLGQYLASRVSTGLGAVDVVLSRVNMTREPQYIARTTSKAPDAPNLCNNAPPASGPTNHAAPRLMFSSNKASIRCSRPTRSGNRARRVGQSSVKIVPLRNETATMCQNCRVPSHANTSRDPMLPMINN